MNNKQLKVKTNKFTRTIDVSLSFIVKKSRQSLKKTSLLIWIEDAKKIKIDTCWDDTTRIIHSFVNKKYFLCSHGTFMKNYTKILLIKVKNFYFFNIF